LFWREIRSRYEHQEFIEIEDNLGWRLDNGLSGPWGGIGVLLCGG
jgi:hypothetical protein